MQIKTALRYHFTPVMMAIMKKMKEECWQGCEGEGSFAHCWWECKLAHPL
jgi:hypothetical protein